MGSESYGKKIHGKLFLEVGKIWEDVVGGDLPYWVLSGSAGLGDGRYELWFGVVECGHFVEESDDGWDHVKVVGGEIVYFDKYGLD